MKKKNLIRDVLEKFEEKVQYDYYPKAFQATIDMAIKDAEAQIKEIFLEWVGGDKFSNKYEIGQARFDEGYNQRGQEIRDKVMG